MFSHTFAEVEEKLTISDFEDWDPEFGYRLVATIWFLKEFAILTFRNLDRDDLFPEFKKHGAMAFVPDLGETQLLFDEKDSVKIPISSILSPSKHEDLVPYGLYREAYVKTCYLSNDLTNLMKPRWSEIVETAKSIVEKQNASNQTV